MTVISKFFTALSKRAYKENDLSDVTYAMCEADPVFNPTFHVRKQNPSGCWGFVCRSSLHCRFGRFGRFA